jgi:outer membrane protein TolC
VVIRRTLAVAIAFSLLPAWAAETPAATAPARNKVKLSQKAVAETVLKQGHKSQEANLTFLQQRFEMAKVFKDYDWSLEAEMGYEYDKLQQFSPRTVIGSSYKRWITKTTLKKPFATTGTLFQLDYGRTSQNSYYSTLASGDPLVPTGPTSLTQDLFTFTIEQKLLNNFFGYADRAKLRAAEETFKAQEVSRTDSLQTVVLDTIKAFWDAYVAKETFQEALSSRDRYKRLVGQIKQKASYGYAKPGELSQVQAEYEGQEQAVKKASTDYLAKEENLVTLLNLEPGTEVEFAVDQAIPPVPKLTPVEVEKLRLMRAQQFRANAARDQLSVSKSIAYPELNLVGKLYSSGYDETASASLSAATSGTHPKYYVGAKFVYSFGSNYQNEDILNKKVTHELEETTLARQKLEQMNLLSQAERSVQSNYAIVQSAIAQNDFRAKAAQELTRTYGQGRTPIKELIDAINNQFNTEVALSRAIGDYQIALNQWAAVRDELIPDDREERK